MPADLALDAQSTAVHINGVATIAGRDGRMRFPGQGKPLLTLSAVIPMQRVRKLGISRLVAVERKNRGHDHGKDDRADDKNWKQPFAPAFHHGEENQGGNHDGREKSKAHSWGEGFQHSMQANRNAFLMPARSRLFVQRHRDRVTDVAGDLGRRVCVHPAGR